MGEKFSLSDIANIAQIVTLPVTILLWAVTAERFARFWRRWLKWIVSAAALIAFYGLWMRGWIRSVAGIQVPLWLVLVCTGALAWFAISWLQIRRLSAKNRAPTSDLIDGIEWEWGYR